MGEVLRQILRGLAGVWLLVLAPFELASTLARLATHVPAGFGLVTTTLVLARFLVVVIGIILGRQIWQRADQVLRAALAWAALDLVTLAAVLASGALPTDRAPGDAVVVWLGYAGAALMVIVAAQMSDDARPGRSR